MGRGGCGVLSYVQLLHVELLHPNSILGLYKMQRSLFSSWSMTRKLPCGDKPLMSNEGQLCVPPLPSFQPTRETHPLHPPSSLCRSHYHFIPVTTPLLTPPFPRHLSSHSYHRRHSHRLSSNQPQFFRDTWSLQRVIPLDPSSQCLAAHTEFLKRPLFFYSWFRHELRSPLPFYSEEDAG